MRMPIVALALGVGSFLVPTEGQSAVACFASLSNIIFGEVYLRDELAQQTIGDLAISCTGGTGGGEVRACLILGQGSGGGTVSARYMRRADNEPLAYQLFSGGHGGTPWDTVEFAVSLDAQGAGQAAAAVYAEVFSSGTDVKGGSYNSSFFGGSAALLRYGEGSCDAGGSSQPDAFQVSASVTPSCTITVGSMDFGDISNQLASGAAASTNLTVTCTDNVPYAVTLGRGTGPDVADPQFRQLSDGLATIAYGLYRDAGGTYPWGWTFGHDDLTGTGSGSSQNFTVYGRVHGGQQAATGNYADSVVVTVQY